MVNRELFKRVDDASANGVMRFVRSIASHQSQPHQSETQAAPRCDSSRKVEREVWSVASAQIPVSRPFRGVKQDEVVDWGESVPVFAIAMSKYH